MLSIRGNSTFEPVTSLLLDIFGAFILHRVSLDPNIIGIAIQNKERGSYQSSEKERSKEGLSSVSRWRKSNRTYVKGT